LADEKLGEEIKKDLSERVAQLKFEAEISIGRELADGFEIYLVHESDIPGEDDLDKFRKIKEFRERNASGYIYMPCIRELVCLADKEKFMMEYWSAIRILSLMYCLKKCFGGYLKE